MKWTPPTFSASGTEFNDTFTAAKYPALFVVGFGDVCVRVNVPDGQIQEQPKHSVKVAFTSHVVLGSVQREQVFSPSLCRSRLEFSSGYMFHAG